MKFAAQYLFSFLFLLFFISIQAMDDPEIGLSTKNEFLDIRQRYITAPFIAPQNSLATQAWQLLTQDQREQLSRHNVDTPKQFLQAIQNYDTDNLPHGGKKRMSDRAHYCCLGTYYIGVAVIACGGMDFLTGQLGFETNVAYHARIVLLMSVLKMGYGKVKSLIPTQKHLHWD